MKVKGKSIATSNFREKKYFSLVVDDFFSNPKLIVDYLKSKHDIDIPHTVEKIGDKFLVEMLDDIDVNKLDNLLDIDDDLLYNATQ